METNNEARTSLERTPLPSVAFVLRHQANADALLNLGVSICNFLGPSPNLTLQEACQSESIALLEWLWGLSCPSAAARSSRWTLCNFLRSDPHYRNYQLDHALKIASSG
ncbi:hypothetical protein PF005_g14608 [Phytophthora fragariae]|uniref:Uncharacterized protein n=1 Tax=Phytophthora fragariae TaxID=53985 RepID=A0A6A4DG64_9STRA|nr:hypothetical protein PF003_g34817 [Phytophthora fragariae]KAE9101960.1 hypothetical protein PF010_g14275 [Phytophthora fragariae]KAE9202311.1 hypothetical protein PF005_g14608 [Phytophthora fragariae]KAE9217971.1 hypothetical protein PF004_g13992 [Phytophthora fragariae]KAE9218993.1 hypothetical protein PF002_g16321 [Phytophthora fragariae]